MKKSRMDDFYEDENCGHCQHHRKDDEEWICNNPDSECFGCYTEYKDTCEDFKERNSYLHFAVEISRKK